MLVTVILGENLQVLQHTNANSKKNFTNKWPCIQPVVNTSINSIAVCRCTISCGHMGEGDIRQHVTGKRHTEKTAEADRAILQPSLKIPRADSALQDKVKNTVLV